MRRGISFLKSSFSILVHINRVFNQNSLTKLINDSFNRVLFVDYFITNLVSTRVEHEEPLLPLFEEGALLLQVAGQVGVSSSSSSSSIHHVVVGRELLERMLVLLLLLLLLHRPFHDHVSRVADLLSARVGQR